MPHGKPAILADGLQKRFGRTQALRGLDLAADEGTILGLLGPNGAGKTTAVRILATLLKPDAGRVEVAGYDVVRRPDEVRARIGLAGQYAAVDEFLTGRGNLELVGRLYQMPAAAARRRAAELLRQFELVNAGDQPVKTYSGGMRRRIDLAASLVAAPPILFLDEPTTGLDPQSRLGLWKLIARLAAGGTTILLTTQYLDEADQLADRIVVVNDGRVIAAGTPGELKAQIGGARLEVVLAPGSDVIAAARALRPYGGDELRVEADRRRLVVPVSEGAGLLPSVVRDLDAAGLRLDDVALRRPTLDEVFLTLTGRPTAPAASDEQSVAGRGKKGEPREEAA